VIPEAERPAAAATADALGCRARPARRPGGLSSIVTGPGPRGGGSGGSSRSGSGGRRGTEGVAHGLRIVATSQRRRPVDSRGGPRPHGPASARLRWQPRPRRGDGDGPGRRRRAGRDRGPRGPLPAVDCLVARRARRADRPIRCFGSVGRRHGGDGSAGRPGPAPGQQRRSSGRLVRGARRCGLAGGHRRHPPVLDPPGPRGPACAPRVVGPGHRRHPLGLDPRADPGAGHLERATAGPQRPREVARVGDRPRSGSMASRPVASRPSASSSSMHGAPSTLGSTSRRSGVRRSLGSRSAATATRRRSDGSWRSSSRRRRPT
jgi:hypothetical protein